MARMTIAEFNALPKAATLKTAVEAVGRLPKGRMNKLETRYGQYLDLQLRAGEIVWWKFEAIQLWLAPQTTLEVDFFLMRPNGALEAHDTKATKKDRLESGAIVYKPLVKDDAHAKMKVAANIFPWPFFYAIELPKALGGGWRLDRV